MSFVHVAVGVGSQIAGSEYEKLELVTVTKVLSSEAGLLYLPTNQGVPTPPVLGACFPMSLSQIPYCQSFVFCFANLICEK